MRCVKVQFDGRVVMIELRNQGRQLLRRGRKRVQEAYQRLSNRLSSAERDQLVRALTEINGVLRKIEE